MSKPQVAYFPQALLLHHLAAKAPVDPKKSTMVRELLMSQIGSQKRAVIAKLKGDYIPEAVISKVAAPKKKQEIKDLDLHFLHLENYKISSLVPEIRIYRREKTGRVTPFYFPISADYETDGTGIVDFKNKSFSSNSAVIENFSVTYTGKNPYTASKKFLEARLSIKVDNISILFDEKSNGQTNYAPLTDLFTIRTVGKREKSKTILGMQKEKPTSALESGESCNVVVSLGYSNHITDTISPVEMRTIQDNRMLINLYYRAHDLNLNTDGSATVSITYQGYLEAKGGNPLYDLVMPVQSKTKFSKDKSSLDKGKKKKDIKNPFTGRKLTEDEEKARKIAEDHIDKARIESILDSFRRIFLTLYNSKKVHTTIFMEALTKKKMVISKDTGPTITGQGVDADGTKYKNYDFFNTPIVSEPPNLYEVLTKNLMHYVTFGDFLDAYLKVLVDDLNTSLEILKDPDLRDDMSKEEYDYNINMFVEHKKELEKLHLLFSDVTYYTKKENVSLQKKKTVNIADIPISVDMIYDLMYKELVSKRKVYLDIDEMLDNFAPTLLDRSFGELPGADFIRPVVILTTNFSAPKMDRKKIKKNEVSIKDVPKPTGKTSTKDVKGLGEYIIFHQKPADHNRPPGSGNKSKDLEKGIIHLRANQDRGLVKNISFSRVNQPARETYMIFRNGQMYDELRYPHNAVVEMYGNNLFLPAMQVYINPDTLGFGDPRGDDSAARRLGFGGYYTSESVTTTYSAGQLSTTVQLFFNCFPSSSDDSSLPGYITRSIKEL